MRDCFDELTHELKADISPVLESINTEVLIKAVQAGMGITVLPEPLAIQYLNDGIFKRLYIDGCKMSTVNYVITLKGKNGNKRYTDIINYFKKAEEQYANFIK